MKKKIDGLNGQGTAQPEISPHNIWNDGDGLSALMAGNVKRDIIQA